MSRAVSIHIGVNRPREPVNAPPLEHSEATAGRMAQLATQAGYNSVLMLRGREATLAAVRNALACAAHTLIRGDFLFVSFSGHGGTVIDATHGAADEDDGKDETWCLHDGMLVDDELVACWEAFQEKVRIVVVSESCYSAGMRRTARGYEYVTEPAAPVPSSTPRREQARGGGPAAPGLRGGPAAPVLRNGRAGRVLRGGGTSAASAGAAASAVPRTPCITEPSRRDICNIKASVLVLTSSGEDKTSQDGFFGHTLLDLWADGPFPGDYCDLYWTLRDRGIRACGQKTHIFMLGAHDPEFPAAPAFRPVPSVVLRGR